MIFTSLGPLGVLLERSWGFFWVSCAVWEASWAILAALVASQVRLGSHGHFGRIEERQGRVLAPTEPREEGAIHATKRGERGGPVEDYRNPTRQHLAF